MPSTFKKRKQKTTPAKEAAWHELLRCRWAASHDPGPCLRPNAQRTLFGRPRLSCNTILLWACNHLAAAFEKTYGSVCPKK
eukprot:1146844-Pelagomonas_calceolata.AAC.5